MKKELLFYSAYETFYDMAEKSNSFKEYCIDAFGADFSQDGFSDIAQINAIVDNIPPSEDLHILDIGCGNGKMLKYLQSKTNAYIHGFDYSKNAIKSALADGNKKSDFRVGIIGKIKYKAKTFDMITSMDTMYFAKDMSLFVAQILKWLKPQGVLFIGYQEGDVMPKTKDSETTLIAKALKDNDLKYEVRDITQVTYDLLKRKRESVIARENDFSGEGLHEWYHVVLNQTNCVTVPYEEYRRNNARYIFIVRQC